MIFPFNDKMGSHASQVGILPRQTSEQEIGHHIVCSLLTLQTCCCVSCGVKKDSACAGGIRVYFSSAVKGISASSDLNRNIMCDLVVL